MAEVRRGELQDEQQYLFEVLCFIEKNVNDLYLHFSNLINGDDSKLNQRFACIKKHFCDVKSNSANILNCLGSGDL